MEGNDRADALAKEVLSIDYVNSTDYLEFEELFTLIKMYIIIINKWQLEYNNNNIGHFYKYVCPIVRTDINYVKAYRHKEVQISRLRLPITDCLFCEGM